MSSDDYSKYLLEGRLSASQYKAIGDAATKQWDADFVQDPKNKRYVDDVVFRRHDNTVRYFLPWLSRVASLQGSRVVDFGSGLRDRSFHSSFVSPPPPNKPKSLKNGTAFGERRSWAPMQCHAKS